MKNPMEMPQRSPMMDDWSDDVDNVENKENLSQKFFLTYRDNTLFKEQVPYLTSALQAQGAAVESHVFPMGTPENEILQWFENNKNLVEDKKIISDNTVSSTIQFAGFNNRELRSKYKEIFGKLAFTEDLDKLSQNVAVEGIYKELKDTYPDKKELLSTEGETFQESDKLYPLIISKIISNPENYPKKVFISQNKITSHGAFVQLDQASDEEILRVSKEVLGGDYVVQDQKLSELETISEEIKEELAKSIHSKETKAKFNAFGAQCFKDWFIAGGIKPEDIEILSEENFIYTAQGDKNWLVADRHIDLSEEDRKKFAESNTKILELPFSNLIKDAINYNLITTSKEEIEKSWEKSAEGITKK